MELAIVTLFLISNGENMPRFYAKGDEETSK
jgi:hypothetical protein